MVSFNIEEVGSLAYNNSIVNGITSAIEHVSIDSDTTVSRQKHGL